VRQHERDLFFELQKVIDDHADTGTIVKDIKKLLRKHESR
jgi:hypothetical protein